jgi:hypothetical protein
MLAPVIVLIAHSENGCFALGQGMIASCDLAIFGPSISLHSQQLSGHF